MSAQSGPDELTITADLARRPARAPDFARENRALQTLARQLGRAPRQQLESLAAVAREVCNAGSAGVSELSTLSTGERVYRWEATVGAWACYAGRSTPADLSLSEICLSRGTPQLFSAPDRLFVHLGETSPPIVEILLIPMMPMAAAGEPPRTLWVVAHDARQRFDAEDVRILSSLAAFAGGSLRASRVPGSASEAATPMNGRIAPPAHALLLDAERRNLYELFIQSIPDAAIFLLDAEGNVQTWNAGAEQIKGYRPDEIIGQHFSIFYPPEDIASGKPWRVLEAARTTGHFAERGWRVRKDGARFWASVNITALRRDGRLIGFAKLTRDLTDQQRIAELEAIDQLKDDLLAAVSHDLKSPLASIKGYAQLLLRSVRRPAPNLENLARGLQTIDQQTDAMSRMLESLLDAARLQSGTYVPRREPCDFDSCLASALSALPPQSRARVDVAAYEPSLAGNWECDKIVEVLDNLLGNALKYSPDGGRVGIAAERSDGEVLVTIRDQGMGIAAEELPTLFARFQRTQQAKASGLPGSGLGLFICRGIVEAHGGRIWAESPGEGQGTAVRFTLPYAPQGAERQSLP